MQWPRRALFALAAMGAILGILQPPVPIRGGAACPRLPFHLCPRLWDAHHVPQHAADDAALYGDGLSRRVHWPLWWLVAAVGLAIVAALHPERAAPLIQAVGLCRPSHSSCRWRVVDRLLKQAAATERARTGASVAQQAWERLFAYGISHPRVARAQVVC
jgi:hypothetical protein